MQKHYAALNNESIIYAIKPEDIDRNYLFKTIDMYSYAIVRGLFNAGELKNSLRLLEEKFDPSKDHPPQSEDREKIRTNFQKLSTGGASLRYNNFPRFFRTFYNPIWCDDIYEMRDKFKTLIRLRNFIYGIDLDFAVEKAEKNGLWSATRIHQYPRGGGFFDGHIDSTLLDVAREKNTNFFQLVLTLSKKGDDFKTGGAFVDREDQRFLIEDICQVGDVLIYDGRSFHGVEDIDENTRLDTSSVNGRVVAMASLYSL